jgi:hypothetical protein
MRWYEFLELYVAHRVPHLNPALRAVLPSLLADQMGLQDFTLEPDRFASYGDDVDGGARGLRVPAAGAGGVRERAGGQRGR